MTDPAPASATANHRPTRPRGPVESGAVVGRTEKEGGARLGLGIHLLPAIAFRDVVGLSMPLTGWRGA